MSHQQQTAFYNGHALWAPCRHAESA